MLAALHTQAPQFLPPLMESSGVDATHQALAELIEGLIQADSHAFPVRFQALLALMRLPHLARPLRNNTWDAPSGARTD